MAFLHSNFFLKSYIPCIFNYYKHKPDGSSKQMNLSVLLNIKKKKVPALRSRLGTASLISKPVTALVAPRLPSTHPGAASGLLNNQAQKSVFIQRMHSLEPKNFSK
jgi:hypothetical protein